MGQIIKRKMTREEAYTEAITMLPEVCLELLRIQNREYHVNALEDYERVFGKAGIIDLYAFYLYAKATKTDEHIVVITFAHDLHGRNDRLMLPRSDGYKETVFELPLIKEEIKNEKETG